MLCCKALENGSSCEEVGRNTRLRPVFPPKLLSCSRRFLRALQWNKAQSKLLYFLIIAQFVICPHLTQWQRNGPACKMSRVRFSAELVFSFFVFSSHFFFLFVCFFCFLSFVFCCFFFFSFNIYIYIYIYFLPIVVLFRFFIYVFFSLFILFPVAFSCFPVFLITSCRSSEEQRQMLRLTYF